MWEWFWYLHLGWLSFTNGIPCWNVAIFFVFGLWFTVGHLSVSLVDGIGSWFTLAGMCAILYGFGLWITLAGMCAILSGFDLWLTLAWTCTILCALFLYQKFQQSHLVFHFLCCHLWFLLSVSDCLVPWLFFQTLHWFGCWIMFSALCCLFVIVLLQRKLVSLPFVLRSLVNFGNDLLLCSQRSPVIRVCPVTSADMGVCGWLLLFLMMLVVFFDN